MRWMYVLVAASIIALGLAATAMAADSGGDTVTGCLQDNGKLKSFTVGNDPLKPCRDGSVEVTLDGGAGQFPGVYALRQNLVAAAGASQGAQLECDPGDVAVSGGWMATDPGMVVVNDFPNFVAGQAPTGWWTGVENRSSSSHSWSAYAVCLDTAP